jgi:hypothetical protein
LNILKIEKFLRSAANGSELATSQLNDILLTLHTDAYRSSLIPKPLPRVRPPKPEPKPGAPKLLDVVPRPLTEISSGRRNVPRMAFTAHGRMSFLRYSKPQSPYLSRVLRQKDDARVKRFDDTERLGVEVEEGRQEDEWNSNLSRELGLDADKGWANVAQGVRQSLLRVDASEASKSNRLALRMMDIAEKEQELADIERKQRRHANLDAKWRVKKEMWDGREVRKTFTSLVKDPPIKQPLLEQGEAETPKEAHNSKPERLTPENGPVMPQPSSLKQYYAMKSSERSWRSR